MVATADALEASALLVSSSISSLTKLVNSSESAVTGVAALAEALWHGVDLLNATCSGFELAVVVEDFDDFKDIRRLPSVARYFSSCNAVMSDADALDLMSLAEHKVPNVTWQGFYVDNGMNFSVLWLAAVRGRDGRLALSTACRHCEFLPRWSNPLWEAFELDPTREEVTIARKASLLVDNIVLKKVPPVWENLPPSPSWWLGLKKGLRWVVRLCFPRGMERLFWPVLGVLVAFCLFQSLVGVGPFLRLLFRLLC